MINTNEMYYGHMTDYEKANMDFLLKKSDHRKYTVSVYGDNGQIIGEKNNMNVYSASDMFNNFMSVKQRTRIRNVVMTEEETPEFRIVF